MQREVFARQLRMARALRKPVVIHSREADEETVGILRDEWSEAGLGCVMHCFGGSVRMAEQVLEMGCYVSFAGNVTFKKAEPLRDAARAVPLERLLVETDCPFLSPVPLRGRRNEPAHVVETARFLAELRGMPLEELARATSENFFRLFGLDPS